MKKMLAMVMTLSLLLAMTACGGNQTEGTSADAGTQTSQTEQNTEKQQATEFTFDLADGETKDVADTIFSQDVTINGNNGRITFVNCEFQENIITTATEGTQIILEQSALDGQCMFQNDVKEATVEWSFPKFLVDSSVDVVSEDCIGSVIALGDFPVSFNGQEFTMQDSAWFYDLSDLEAGLVPYEGQDANYYCVVQWWEGDEKVVFVECEYDPNMEA